MLPCIIHVCMHVHTVCYVHTCTQTEIVYLVSYTPLFHLVIYNWYFFIALNILANMIVIDFKGLHLVGLCYGRSCVSSYTYFLVTSMDYFF
jgi:hypothetical protein